MPTSHRPTAPTRSRRVVLPAFLGLLMAAGAAPAGVGAATSNGVAPAVPTALQATVRASTGAGAGAATTSDAPRLRPTIQYEDAVRHAHDRTTFAAGERVLVPFAPRTGDDWTVDGRSPRALPAGRVSGRTMRLSDGATDAARPKLGRPRTSTERRTAGDRPATAVGALGDDRPIVDPRSLIRGTPTVWDPSSDPSFELAAAIDPGALKREVFGFLPYWELSDSSTRIDWSTVSTVAYFGVGADRDGSLIKRNGDGATTVGWSGWTSSRMTKVIDAAHRSGARVVLTVQSFAWSSAGSKRQRALLRSATARARLARQVAAAVRDRGADGVNLDFEPIVPGYGDEFTALVRKVRAALSHIHRGYQLTFDATGSIGEYPIAAATRKGGADAVLVMGYDYRGPNSKVVGSVAPIGGSAYDVRETIQAYLKRVPASKVILGVPYYGRAWSTPNASLHAKNISGPKYGPSVTVTYDDAKAVVGITGRRYDKTEGVAWTAYKRQNCTKAYGCVTAWRQLYYDDAKALGAKYDLVNAYGLRGVGIWALGYDGKRRDLTKAITAKFIRDKVPPVIAGASLSRPIVSPNGDGRADDTTVGLKATGLISWGVRIQVLKGRKVGRTIRSGSHAGKAPVFRWDGLDAHHHRVKDGTYRLTMWAADINGNHASRAFTVTVDATRAKVTPSTGAGFVTPDHDGRADSVALGWHSSEAITGTTTILDPKGKAVRSWAIADKATWSTAWRATRPHGKTLKDGRYTLRVAGLDRAGNRTVVERRVIVDRTVHRVRWSKSSFAPSTKATSRATIELARSATVTVRILRAGKVIRRGWTAKPLHAGSWGWTWDGRTSKGAIARPGRYTIVVTATSRIGMTRYTQGITVAGR